MKDGTYITIQSWMRTELDLKGNDLIVYAIIFGFSQTENTKFTGSLQYLADWCGATKQGMLKNIKNLLDRGLIEKNEEVKNGIKFVEYYATKLNTPLNKVEYPIKQSLTNNTSNNQTNKTIISKDIIEDIVENQSEWFLENYHNICVSLPKVKALTDKRKKAISKLMKLYSKDDILKVFEYSQNSSFLTGDNDRGWKADIDFLLRNDKFLNILEGKYGGKKRGRNTMTDIEHMSGLAERGKRGDKSGTQF